MWYDISIYSILTSAHTPADTTAPSSQKEGGGGGGGTEQNSNTAGVRDALITAACVPATHVLACVDDAAMAAAGRMGGSADRVARACLWQAVPNAHAVLYAVFRQAAVI